MKLWGGRFAGRTDPLFEKFSESFSLDRRLVLYDLRVNRAYVRALGRARALKPGEVRRLDRGLQLVESYVRSHPGWARNAAAEDVHTWVEAELERRVGAVARKLRTGRSRNDLVATDTRLYVKDAVRGLQRAELEILESLLAQTRRNAGAVLPGYTHLQPAQPILFAHYLLAYFEMLLRDVGRLEDCLVRADELPMGAGALAGTTFAIDRKRLARELGFARVARNSLDVTSDRDFIVELLLGCALTMIHLSRLAEDLVIYSSPGFGYVELADAYSTGSSLMPQKKNPDSLELIRGKAATVLGRFMGLLALLKGLPMSYDRDLQEDKVALFEGVETTRQALEISARVVATLRINRERMKAMTQQGFLTATDVADELVRRGVPFAEAHEQVGKLVRHCAQRRLTFEEIAPTDAKRIIPAWDARLHAIAVSPERAVRRRNVIGGTAPAQVARQLKVASQTLAQLRRRIGRA